MCMYKRRNAYYYVQAGKWFPLGRDYEAALKKYEQLREKPLPKRYRDGLSAYVYVIAPADANRPIKIGVARDVNRRLAALQTAWHEPLSIKHTTYFDHRTDALTAEKAVHAALEDHRMRGEWFEIEDHEAVKILAHWVSNKSVQYPILSVGHS